MSCNFDEIIDRRGTNALNTDGFRGYIFHAGPEKVFPFKDEEFVRMWVADMEFATPDAICEAMKERIDRRIFGYTAMFDNSFYDAFSAWCDKKYGWGFPKEELCFAPGIIPALYELVEQLCPNETDKILITSPAYGYFKHAAEYGNRELVCSKLKIDNGYFSLDLDDFADKAANKDVKLVIWCNPHNPTGRVWTEDELRAIADIVEKNELWIISDEIHCDLLRVGMKHIPMGKVMPEYKKLVTCMSASKTFNMAGLMFSDIIIRDEALRASFTARDKTVGFLNPISLAAHTAAYEHCFEWLEELRAYLDANFRFVKDFFAEKLPEVEMNIPEATYLAWVKIGPALPGISDHSSFFADRAGVLLEGGDDLFVDNAAGYIRLNLAMPRSIIEEGLNRMYKSIMDYRAEY